MLQDGVGDKHEYSGQHGAIQCQNNLTKPGVIYLYILDALSDIISGFIVEGVMSHDVLGDHVYFFYYLLT